MATGSVALFLQRVLWILWNKFLDIAAQMNSDSLCGDVFACKGGANMKNKSNLSWSNILFVVFCLAIPFIADCIAIGIIIADVISKM